MTKGEELYKSTCAACHQATGAGIPGTFPPLIAGQEYSAGEPALKALRDRGFIDADNKIAMGPVEKHLDIVLNGITGTAMQSFGGQLSDAEVAAIVTYERNAWGNDTGDVIQPSDVKAGR